ncbi:polysaccharide pyruvyl transferase family protein [Metabacillus litoralis]|uniref:polysaccharide pyruvyl transferase family protein n=1 Tax=Metabacillus litoralis TaxID=152268 RepID=UPI001CFCE39D|nr:polysaccharide pyruvyl transferase family protein [Metabacillus litoralis]
MGQNLPSVEQQRELLREKKILAGEYFRILHIGRYAFGKTDIVSRMKQALENLGHTVFDFNTDDFPVVIHNPDRHTGGFGPIEIKLDLIKPLLKQFDPQIIVCNAGGYTFSEEDSKWLKDQGYILVGITLSDPDVFPGTKKFAHRFDYHATNAVEALEMYKEAGINNTIHWPFAIDRSFIEAEAVERPDWKADVICIGNAFNRPDRNSMMNYLDEHFEVKVYGTGWEIPNSFPVSGEDFYSAARAGKFHINFPGTRAGFTNLKIGVFESIANGGILCTEIFEEMELFFEYGKEIIGYKDAEDLKEKLEYYINHPEEAEMIRRRGFEKLVKHHMWETRWQDLLTQIQNDINSKQTKLSKGRYEQINELHGTKEKAAKVIIQGYYGALNTGDDLILEAISTNIKKKYPNTLIMVAGFNRRPITLKQGFYSLPRTDVYRMDKYIKEADLLIYGGGGLLNDYTFNKAAGVPDFFDRFTHGLTGMGTIPTMANIYEVPSMYFALGVGPLVNPEARKFAKFMVNQMSVVTVRDEYSKNLLESIPGLTKEVNQTSDATYMLDDPGDEAAAAYFKKYNIESKNLILLTMRDWKDNPVNFEEKMARYLDSILADSNYTILFLPYQFGKGKSDDNKIHGKVQELMSNQSRTLVYEHEGDYTEFLSIVKNAGLSISMRLHGSILANLFGVPSIGFNYDDKVLAHYQNLHMDQYLLDLDFDVDHAIKTFKDLEANKEQMSDSIMKYVAREKEKSSKSYEFAVQLLEQGVKREKDIYRHYPREESLHKVNEQALLKELTMLRLENRELQSNFKVMQNAMNMMKIDDLEKVDLSKAIIECQDRALNEQVILSHKSNKIGIRLSDLDAPKKGDFSTARVQLNVEPGTEYALNVTVHSPYCKPKNVGRIQYQLKLDGKKLYKEDIAEDGNEKVLTFNIKPKRKNITLELRLDSLKNCESWRWGSASKTSIYDISLIKLGKSKPKQGIVKRVLSKN